MRLGKLQRRERIIAELRANPAVRVAALARAFGVSTETVRRDLDALSDGGLVSRTYGGAALPAIGVEPSVAERQRELTQERERIARRAFELLAPREVVMIDCGSTTWHFARRLAIEPLPLTVVTNSLGIATTAEGVETKEQLQKVREEGCTEMQGYLFSPPRPMKDIVRLFA